jgi:adenylate cyclase
LRQIDIPPTSAIIKFNQKERDIYKIAEQLGVDAILDGNFRREGERLRVNVQLVDVKNKTVLWSDAFGENSDDIFFIQEQIAENIAHFYNLN